MSSPTEFLSLARHYAEQLAAMGWLVFVIAAISAGVGYIAAVLIHRRQITEQREDNRLTLQLERKELTEFMHHVQAVASTVDEKVDRHSLSLTDISQDLSQIEEPDPKVVLRAVKQLFEANKHLHGELSSAKDQINVKQQQLESYMAEARTDTLTGISNRRAFDEQLHRQFALRERRSSDLCLLMADIDHFKMFNDYHGHQVGDEMLRRVAEALEQATRSSDIVCRYGGEEFAVLLPRTKLADALRVAERARTCVESLRCQIGECELHVTTSIGIVELRTGDDRVDFVKRGDQALYAAKIAGRNCVWHEANPTSQKLDQAMAAITVPSEPPNSVAVGPDSDRVGHVVA